jgi:hydroxypyruvate isomerase
MPQFAANLSMLYPEHAFLDRFEAAARDGFEAVEFLFPYEHAPGELAARLRAHGLKQVLFNAPPGDWDAGERGLACLPNRDAGFREGIGTALRYADTLRCPRIHVMAGIVPAGGDREAHLTCYRERLGWAAREGAIHGVDMTIEPINTRDIPGFFLNRQEQAHDVVAAVGAPNLKVQMDLYHCQIVEGDLAAKLRRYIPTGKVGHIQIAGVPDRHEPDIGEVNYRYLFSLLDDLGYAGWIGCEYRPRRGVEAGGTSAGLAWHRPYR